MAYAVTTTRLQKSYGPQLVLDGIDLAVEVGSVFALLGPNGAGKTTLINVLSTLVRPDSGSATVAGRDLIADAAGVRESISVTGQYVALDDVLTVAENLMLMSRLRHLAKKQARARTEELIVAFDLGDVRDRRLAACSGGTRRRVDLAVSLIHRPPLVFLDEPTTGLDPRSREQTWTAVRQLVEGGTTVLLTTQYLEEADRLADRIAMLDGGRIVAEGTADELKAGISSDIARLEFLDDETCRRVAVLLDVPAPRDDDRLAVEVPTNGTPDAVRQLLNSLHSRGLDAHRLTLHRPSLDDVFMSLTTPDHADHADHADHDDTMAGAR